MLEREIKITQDAQDTTIKQEIWPVERSTSPEELAKMCDEVILENFELFVKLSSL